MKSNKESQKNWYWNDDWSLWKEKYYQWDFYTIFITINNDSLINQIVEMNKKFSIITPYLHITLHYPFTIQEGFYEDDIFRVLSQFLSGFESPTFSIRDAIWLHKNRDKPENIIALGIEQSSDFEKIRIGLTDALHPYIVATAPFEKDPQYKIKARPHVSIAYRLDYHSAKLLFDHLIKKQKSETSGTLFQMCPIPGITLRKNKTFFHFDFKGKRWITGDTFR